MSDAPSSTFTPVPLDKSKRTWLIASTCAGAAGAVFAYGNFITILVNFILLAFIIFMMVKQINRLKREQPAAAPEAPPEEVTLLREIRDSLKR